MSTTTYIVAHPVILETERLLLKAITPVLIHEMMENMSEKDFLAYQALGASDYAMYVDMHTKGIETYRISMYSFLLVDKASGTPIGDCGFHTWNAHHARTELFYNMRNENFQKKGLMKEALKKVLEFGFTTLKLNRIAALAYSENIPSIKLIEGNGFVFEGTARQDYFVDGEYTDSVCYSLLKSEWEKRTLNTKH